jgi:phenylalanyl-tRNA synthetase alpha chain
MLEQIEELASRAFDELKQVTGQDQLETWRVRYLGRKSDLVQLLRSLSSLPIEERRQAGARANQIKKSIEDALAEKASDIEGSFSRSSQESLDVSLPGESLSLGRLHPTTQAFQEICDIFKGMGFHVVEGPEVEWEFYNFEALNMPIGHPARDSFATLWVSGEPDQKKGSKLLRTHTSPVQIRTMEKTRPPIRVIAPGRVYRYEATDTTHEWMFHQVEGLAIDTNITMADLKGTLAEFIRRMFGKDRKFRFRCDYFPFVEPGVDVAMDCLNCGGTGCRMCSHSGWIEILGAGMVHPAVLRRMGIDPDVHSGFAFGMGVERIPILRYGIDDIRHFYSNDLRFLGQF